MVSKNVVPDQSSPNIPLIFLFPSRSTANVHVHHLSEGLVNQGVKGADQPSTTPHLGPLPVQIPQAGYLVLIGPWHAPLWVVVVGLEQDWSGKLDPLDVHGMFGQGAVGGQLVTLSLPGLHQQVCIQNLSHPTRVDVWVNASERVRLVTFKKHKEV